jgi:cold shock CspA family protein
VPDVPDRPPLPLADVFATRTGTITAFDDQVGAGTVTDDADGRAWWFHCTRIADGRRTIEVGTAVTYRVEPGPSGLEAVAVAPG